MKNLLTAAALTGAAMMSPAHAEAASANMYTLINLLTCHNNCVTR